MMRVINIQIVLAALALFDTAHGLGIFQRAKDRIFSAGAGRVQTKEPAPEQAMKPISEVSAQFYRLLHTKGEEDALQYFRSVSHSFSHATHYYAEQLATGAAKERLLAMTAGDIVQSTSWLPSIRKRKPVKASKVTEQLSTGLMLEILSRGMEPFPRSQAGFLWQQMRDHPISWPQFMAYVESLLAYQQLADLDRLLTEMSEIVKSSDKDKAPPFKPSHKKMSQLLQKLLSAAVPVGIIESLIKGQELQSDEKALLNIVVGGSGDPAYFADLLTMYVRNDLPIKHWPAPVQVDQLLVSIAQTALQSKYDKRNEAELYQKTNDLADSYQPDALNEAELQFFEAALRGVQCVSQSPPLVCRVLRDLGRRLARGASKPLKYPNLAFLVKGPKLSQKFLSGLAGNSAVLAQAIIILQHEGNELETISKMIDCKGLAGCNAVKELARAKLGKAHAKCGPQGTKITVVNLPGAIFSYFEALTTDRQRDDLARAIAVIIMGVRLADLPAEALQIGSESARDLHLLLNYYFNSFCHSPEIPLYHVIPGLQPS